jgi:hypothetical protein
MLGSLQNFTQLGGRADSLCPFTWSGVSGLMQFRDEYNKVTSSNAVQISVRGRNH